MSTPRVAVIVPVRDAGTLLRRALASVAAQTVSDHETVIVDDGSRHPRTLALLETAKRSRGIRVARHPEPRGPAAARNRAVGETRAPFLLPLDADDWLKPDFLAKTLAAIDREPGADIAHSWVGLAGGHHGVWRTGPLAIPPLLARCTLHVTALVRREVWERVGGWDERFRDGAEDWDFWIAAAAAGARAVAVPEVLCHYWRGPRSRERRARTPGTSRRLMSQLVAKHRALYAAHLEEAFAALYEEYAQVCNALERLHANPLVRAAAHVRHLLRRPGRHA